MMCKDLLIIFSSNLVNKWGTIIALFFLANLIHSGYKTNINSTIWTNNYLKVIDFTKLQIFFFNIVQIFTTLNK